MLILVIPRIRLQTHNHSFLSYIFTTHINAGKIHFIKNENLKQNYFRPTMSVCSIVEESFILVASPNVRPGGDNGGSIQVIDLRPDVGENDDNLEG